MVTSNAQGKGISAGPNLTLNFDHAGAASQLPLPLSLNCQINGSGVTAIFGPSGAGKTTLLRAIAGLHYQPGAELSYGEHIWQSADCFVPPQKRRLGYVFQEPGLFPHLDVAGNLLFAKKRRFTAYDPVYEKDVIDTLDITPLLSASVTTLSGGERQRVAIARALLSGPDLLLLDEPLAALDEPRKKAILRYLNRIQAKLRLPMLYVSHSRDEVIQLADQVLLLDKGRLAGSGTPHEVFADVSHPQQLECVLAGTVVEQQTQWHLLSLDCGGFKVWLPDSGHQLGESLRIRIEPKDVSISLNQNTQSSMLNILPASVEACHRADGSVKGESGQAESGKSCDGQVIVTLNVAGHRLFSVITAWSANRLELVPGKQVFAQIKSVAVHSA